MSLLRLTPESERLRRIAKAHAAGEISRDEFRRIRSGVIAGFAEGGCGADLGDDTQRRWFASDNTTQPFVPGTAATVDGVPRQTTTLRLVGLLLVVVALALAGAVTAHALPPTSTGDALLELPEPPLPVDDLGVDWLEGPRALPFGVPSADPQGADEEKRQRPSEVAAQAQTR